ncbi:MAG: sulfatase-like hydrolase/transferase [Flavobacteriaceae bacterium]
MKFLFRDIKNHAIFSLLAGLASGLYPILFYYSNNFALVNSWEHLNYFLFFFLLLPVSGFFLIFQLFNLPFLKKWQKYVLPFLAVFVFLFLMKVCLYSGFQKEIVGVIFCLSVILSFLFYKHLKKIVIFQFLLAIIGVYTVTNTLISQANFSEEWKKPTDAISQALFKKKPNIYFIQPDGLVNFSELKKGKYEFDNSYFENYLIEKGFKNYANFRSNYASTLSTNSSVFMMKHHFYNKGLSFSEGVDARDVIISHNTVLTTLQNNGYKTHFISEEPYFLINRPQISYDYCNFNFDEIGFITKGFGFQKDILKEVDTVLSFTEAKPKFFFIEFFNPGHIKGSKETSRGSKKEREAWFESLQTANYKLEHLINSILTIDPEALIMIMADHGGFVGMEYTNQIYEKTQDRDIIYSIFSSQLSIHWPNNEVPKIDENFKSSVNVFRILFSYLSENNAYLKNLEPDESYVIINKGAPKGVYQYINTEGNIVFKKH